MVFSSVRSHGTDFVQKHDILSVDTWSAPALQLFLTADSARLLLRPRCFAVKNSSHLVRLGRRAPFPDRQCACVRTMCSQRLRDLIPAPSSGFSRQLMDEIQWAILKVRKQPLVKQRNWRGQAV